jgi:hypothetical protein
VQRIRIRLSASPIDSGTVNAPSYPSIAVEANPANTIEMARFIGYPDRLLPGSRAKPPPPTWLFGASFLLVRDRFNGVERDSNPVPQRNAVFHIEEKCLHRRHLV